MPLGIAEMPTLPFTLHFRPTHLRTISIVGMKAKNLPTMHSLRPEVTLSTKASRIEITSPLAQCATLGFSTNSTLITLVPTKEFLHPIGVLNVDTFPPLVRAIEVDGFPYPDGVVAGIVPICRSTTPQSKVKTSKSLCSVNTICRFGHGGGSGGLGPAMNWIQN